MFIINWSGLEPFQDCAMYHSNHFSAMVRKISIVVEIVNELSKGPGATGKTAVKWEWRVVDSGGHAIGRLRTKTKASQLEIP